MSIEERYEAIIKPAISEFPVMGLHGASTETIAAGIDMPSIADRKEWAHLVLE